MISYILQRLLSGIILIFLLSTLSFFIIQAPPGDFASVYVSSLQGQAMTAERREEMTAVIRRQYGLDRPLVEQYVLWVGNIVIKGDFGHSFTWDRPVARILAERLPITIAIGLLALFFQYIVAIPMAVISAVRQNSPLDYGLTFISFVGMSIPNFLLALVLLVLLFNAFPGFPIGGLFSQQYQGGTPWTMGKVIDLLQHLLVPVVVVAMSSTAGTVRTLRATLLDELGMEYVRVARAKGLSERRIIYKYPLRIALNPIIASIGWSLPIIVSGAVLISIVTNIPDIGPVLFQALRSQDSYLAGAIVFMLSALTIFGTLLSDVLLAVSDPRISFTGGNS